MSGEGGVVALPKYCGNCLVNLPEKATICYVCGSDDVHKHEVDLGDEVDLNLEMCTETLPKLI